MKIVVRSIAGEKYDRIVGYTLGAMPEPVPVGDAYDWHDVPFCGAITCTQWHHRQRSSPMSSGCVGNPAALETEQRPIGLRPAVARSAAPTRSCPIYSPLGIYATLEARLFRSHGPNAQRQAKMAAATTRRTRRLVDLARSTNGRSRKRCTGRMNTDFAELLARYITQLRGLRSRGASEDAVRDAFLGWLRDAFPRLHCAEPIMLEKYIPALRVRGGFADAIFGDLIFEFKRRLDERSRGEGLGELASYIANQQHPERFFGILTDGETLEVHVWRAGELAKLDQLRLEVEAPERVKLWLDCYLFHEKQVAPTADDVALRFGLRSPTFWHSMRLLESLWGQRGHTGAVQAKYAEWCSLLSIVYGSTVGDKRLFMCHTYLAMFARLLAFVVLYRRAPEYAEQPGILSGSAFQAQGLEDFVEDDFFTWIGDPTVTPAAAELLHGMATRLTAAYDLGAVQEDLLKELYQELVDPQTRHDLGEFYTPDWLAELTLRQAGFPPAELIADPERVLASDNAPSVLDPACGSGTFLFTAVRMLRQAGLGAHHLVEFCQRHLAGMDVHPLAVTIAKTNLVLAMGDAVQHHRRPMRLGVYLADSLAAANQQDAAPELFVPVQVDDLARWSNKPKPPGLPEGFGLPVDVAQTPEMLHELLGAMLEFANPALTTDEADQGFARRLNALGVPSAQHHTWLANLDLLRWLLAPPISDGVWRFILRNAYQPELLARRKFTFVVGNPPWLAYRYVKRQDYQQRLRQAVFRYGLLEKSHRHLFTHIELATIFFAFCAARYLAPKGTLAFVMPRSILTGAKHHQAFRQRYLLGCKLVIDCEQVSPLFNVPACVAILSAENLAVTYGGHPVKEQVPLLRVSLQLPCRNAHYQQAEALWQLHQERYSVPDARPGSPYLGQIVEGASLAPRCVWFVQTNPEARLVARDEPWLQTDTAIQAKAKPPWKGITLQGKVEAEFLFATLLADNMLPFGWRRLSLVVLPAQWPDKGRGRMIDVSTAAISGRLNLANWLRRATEIWDAHRKSEIALLDWVNWGNKIIRQRPAGVLKLLYGCAGTHTCACVVDTRSTWSLQRLEIEKFIADSTTYWFETKSVFEAHYLCAVLNAPCVDAAIKPHQTKGAFGALSGKGHRHISRRPFEVLPIPRYTHGDERHRRLARLSQLAHEKVAAAVAGAPERWLSDSIGRLRRQLRTELVSQELAEIDALVQELLGPLAKSTQ